MQELCKKVFRFYVEGFQNMKVGKKLWAILAIKFFIFFIVLKIFFFPDILQTKFSNDHERANYVMENITQ
ncbi:DUF4492 domain-containing protein [Sulfurospirillum sp. 1612]|uniref:DUF4492 domain-containing protein n=1 Tax=Sulfurospirillum sp. 1612 TaxID=3094835 RepID=UPI002F95E634